MSVEYNLWLQLTEANALSSEVGQNTADIATLQGEIGTIPAVTAQVEQNTTDITTLQGEVSGLPALTSEVGKNTTDITTLQGEVSTLQSEVAVLPALTTQVDTNTSNIATNTSNIATNTSNITKLRSAILRAVSGTPVDITADMGGQVIILTGYSTTQSFTHSTLAIGDAGLCVMVKNGNFTTPAQDITISGVSGATTIHGATNSQNAQVVVIYWNGTTLTAY